jgi:pimeloyl-ACP methyl ester carboxylesterase
MPLVTSHDGLSLAVDVRPGEGTSALFVHATGFCKETWGPVLDHLDGVPAISLDQRGHGGSGQPAPPFDWWDLGADLSTVLEATNAGPVVGVGHSSGGAALAMAEIEHPGTFTALVLIEPIIYPPPHRRHEDAPLAVRTERRKASFASLDAALESFRGRGPFSGWIEDALRAYVEHGTVDAGDQRRLACPPEVEAEFYRAAYAHGAWDRLGEIGCPVAVVVGEHSDTHTPEFTEALASRFRTGRTITILEASHFVPMEKPRRTAEVIRDALAT